MPDATACEFTRYYILNFSFLGYLYSIVLLFYLEYLKTLITFYSISFAFFSCLFLFKKSSYKVIKKALLNCLLIIKEEHKIFLITFLLEIFLVFIISYFNPSKVEFLHISSFYYAIYILAYFLFLFIFYKTKLLQKVVVLFLMIGFFPVVSFKKNTTSDYNNIETTIQPLVSASTMTPYCMYLLIKKSEYNSSKNVSYENYSTTCEVKRYAKSILPYTFFQIFIAFIILSVLKIKSEENTE